MTHNTVSFLGGTKTFTVTIKKDFVRHVIQHFKVWFPRTQTKETKKICAFTSRMTINPRHFAPQIVLVSGARQPNEQNPRDVVGLRKNESTTKRVTFAMTPNLSIHAQFIEPSHELRDEIKSDIWWSAEEIRSKSLERKRLAKAFRKELEEGFCALYKNCESLSFSQVMRTKTAKQLLFEATDADERRGLEMGLSIQVLKKRKQHVLWILSIKEEGAPDEILSAASAKSSRASQMLARVLAQLDKVEAS
jgi:hypothetical protein